MKRSRMLVFLTASLAILMLFTSCSFIKRDKNVGDVLSDAVAYAGGSKTLTSWKKVSDLIDAKADQKVGNLIAFSKVDSKDANKTKYMVFNVDTGAIVWEDTSTKDKKIEISLNSISYYELFEKTPTYFAVTTITTDSNKSTTAVSLYSATGDLVVKVDRDATVSVMADLLYLDGKCYRVAADGSISEAFEFSSLAGKPDIEIRYQDRYYGRGQGTLGNYLVVYDDSLKMISKYFLPQYIDNCVYTVLEDGNIFLQYTYEVDAYADKYTFIGEGTDGMKKFMMVTQIVDVESGKARDIRWCKYFMAFAMNLAYMPEESKEEGYDLDEFPVMGIAFQIEDKHVANCALVGINNKGKISEIVTDSEQPIVDIMRISDDRWIVTDASETDYLMDETGEIIGDVTGGTIFGKYFYADGKVYDFDLAEVYDYQAASLTVKYVVGDALLLKGNDGRLLLYTGNGDPVVLIEKDSVKTLLESYGGDSYILIRNKDKLEIYNDDGAKIVGIDNLNFNSLDVINLDVLTTDEGSLLKFTNKGGETVYYHLG